MSSDIATPIAVVGLWHLGTTIAASWLELGYRVCAVDLDASRVASLRRGEAPVKETGVDEALVGGLSDGRLEVTTDFGAIANSKFCFIADDTLLDADGAPLVESVVRDVLRCASHLRGGSVIVASAQLPVGTSRDLRARAQGVNMDLELVYVPENLRLGQALECYARPGHTVIGSAVDWPAQAVADLFEPMGARILQMSLESAEMVKHTLNAMLGTSVTLANHFADLCAVTGAEYSDVVLALRADPRVGAKAYLAAGTGFAGGTLSRDLLVLDRLSRDRMDGSAPLFGEVLRYNDRRIEQLATNVARVIRPGGKVCLLGATYKAGTSTLRRSQTLELAQRLLAGGYSVAAQDPGANWSEEPLPVGLLVFDQVVDAATDAELLILMTEWPQYRDLDPAALRRVVRKAHLLDPKGFLQSREMLFASTGWELSFSIWPLRSWSA